MNICVSDLSNKVIWENPYFSQISKVWGHIKTKREDKRKKKDESF